MILKDFIETHYARVNQTRKEFDQDYKMKAMVASKQFDSSLTKNFMRENGLFRRTNKFQRGRLLEIYAFYIEYFCVDEDFIITDEILEDAAFQLLMSVYCILSRAELAVNSKLIYFVFPERIALYDPLVEKALTVLQNLVPGLSALPKIGQQPRVRSKSDVSTLVDYYMDYQKILFLLIVDYQEQLNQLRAKHQVIDFDDILIMHQLLQILGHPGDPQLYIRH